MSNKAIQVPIDADLIERFERLAAEQDRPTEFLLDEALGDYLLREEESAADRKAIALSLEEFERTGLHLTNAEVMEWLERRARGEDVPLPPTHT